MRVFPCENSFKFKHKTFTRVLRVLNIGEPHLTATSTVIRSPLVITDTFFRPGKNKSFIRPTATFEISNSRISYDFYFLMRILVRNSEN